MKQIIADIRHTIQTFDPSTRQLRALGIVLCIVLGIFAYAFWSALFAACAIVSLLWAYFAPQLFLPILKVLMIITVPIGMFLSTIILTLFFFLVITPVGLLGSLIGHDPLRLRQNGRKSNWEDVEENVHHDKMSP